MKTILTIAWPIGTINKVNFKKYDAKRVHIITDLVHLINNVRYYNIASSIFDENCNAGFKGLLAKRVPSNFRWRPPLEDWIKISVDGSMKNAIKVNWKGYVMRDN